MTATAKELPRTLPITVEQYHILVEQAAFKDRRGQVELIHGRIVELNPQGPSHADPIDELEEWSHQQASSHFRIRIEKPIEIPGLDSCPEPDVAWVTRRRYRDRHPNPSDIHLLIEVSVNSQSFDQGEKKVLYAEAGIAEYWIVDVRAHTVQKLTDPIDGAYQKSENFTVHDHLFPQCLPQASLSVARLFDNAAE
jgi:Uma2 family endonuclease